MTNKSLFIPILISIIILIIFAGGYLYMTSGDTGNAPASSSVVSSNTSDLFSKIDSIQLDTGIFSDPRFNALTDITIATVNEPLGRTNPFATLH